MPDDVATSSGIRANTLVSLILRWAKGRNAARKPDAFRHPKGRGVRALGAR